MDDEVASLLAALRARGETLASCESLTGGMVGAAITSVPGSSDVYRGGLVTYATDLKVSLAGVPRGVIDAYGVVSAEVALAMASGARASCGADWGVATTGVAGPGAQDAVPAGTVWIAVVGPHTRLARPLSVEEDRSGVRRESVLRAIELLRDSVEMIE